jgi:hypothetical protein
MEGTKLPLQEEEKKSTEVMDNLLTTLSLNTK